MSKKKGVNTERELVHLLWKNGWAACRVAGSGSMRYPAPDIIACKENNFIAIECKSTSEEKQYIVKKDVEELQEFCERALMKPVIALRFSREDWRFLNKNDFKKTEKSYVISKENALKKGAKVL